MTGTSAMKVQEPEANEGNRRTAAISVWTSVYRAANSTCIGTIGSAEGVSFGGVIREAAPGVCEGVSTLFAPGVITPDIAPGKLPKNGPVSGARASLGVVVSETAGGFVPKRGPGVTLESG